MLKRVRLARFRSLSPTDWRPAGGANLIGGPNGSGKTSLLEAIYLAATTRSFRTSALAECCARGGGSFDIVAEVEHDGLWDLAVGFADGSRRATVQARPSALAEHLSLLPVVAWSAAEHELVSGPSLGRRRFLDRAALLLRPARLAEHAELHRALAQKRHLLAARAGRDPSAADLGAWNDLLAPLIARRAQERAELTTRLERAATGILAARGSDLPPLRLTYQPSPVEALAGVAAVAAALERAVPRERERRQPLVGPQRDRVEVTLDDAAARRFASAGERKLLALSLLAGLVELLAAAGNAPLVLLDDLDAELDRNRLRLARALFGGALQTITTTSRPELFDTPPAGALWALAQGAFAAV